MNLLFFFSLRNSELRYLNESFAFFSAVRSRDYFSKASIEKQPDLLVKKLRYYARFIVVCCLLHKIELAKELLKVDYYFF